MQQGCSALLLGQRNDVGRGGRRKGRGAGRRKDGQNRTTLTLLQDEYILIREKVQFVHRRLLINVTQRKNDETGRV